MNSHPYLSSYLVIPPGKIAAKANRHWSRRRLGRQILDAWHMQPRARIWVGLGVWSFVVGGLIGTAEAHPVPAKPPAVASSAASSSAPAKTPPRVIETAAILPGGPTGQLMPPGTMAPAYTYKSSYTRGQCTWYVAGRRMVPSGWGNARSWFSNAQHAGWATGTVPAVAAIAWTPAGYYGHVALVEAVDPATNQVLISEMNYMGPYKIDKRWAPASQFKYIY